MLALQFISYLQLMYLHKVMSEGKVNLELNSETNICQNLA